MITLTPGPDGVYVAAMPPPVARIVVAFIVGAIARPYRPNTSPSLVYAPAQRREQPPCDHGAKGSVCHDCGWLP